MTGGKKKTCQAVRKEKVRTVHRPAKSPRLEKNERQGEQKKKKRKNA